MTFKQEITIEDFLKLDLRVAKIENVEDILGADKLYKLTINLGEETRTLCAGIKRNYSKEDLLGKNIVVIANLKPRMLKGIESKGMLLAASNSDHSKVILLSPEKDIEPGISIG